jgi:cell division protein FtsA
MKGTLFGLDIGTTKVAAIVGEVRDGKLQIIGVGIEPSRGMRKGMIVDVNEASIAIASAVEKAEQSSGYELKHALVSMAGEHLDSTNSWGSTSISNSSEGVTRADIERALDVAQSAHIPSDRQIVHLVPRTFTVDDHKGVHSPLGMFGNKLDVEAHIVTATSAALKNLSACVEKIGVEAEELVLNVLASAEAVLEPSEKEMGVIIADIGGGTTDIALYTGGAVWHTAVIPIGGHHITNDIAIGLRVPFDVAESVKLRYGDCRPKEIDSDNVFNVTPFGGEKIIVGWQDLAFVVEARVEELFDMVLRSLKESGYTGMLPAGIVLTGGSAQLRGITTVAERVLNVPARVAAPKQLVGLVDALRSPSYSTSVGLLQWALSGNNAFRPREAGRSGQRPEWGRRLGGLISLFLPDRES